ncbi:MAG: DUF2946 family protein [Pirellulales bacterium]|nr:DUF2946 family protein [Pirellulales bacterium]
MTLLHRPLLTSILCGVVLLGHTPAWLHVAQCEGHASTEVLHSDEKHPHRHVSCCEGHHEGSLAHHSTGGGHHHHHDGSGSHDSDHCVICQSLASAKGVVAGIDLAEAVQPAFEAKFFAVKIALPSDPFSLAHPRGPPAV